MSEHESEGSKEERSMQRGGTPGDRAGRSTGKQLMGRPVISISDGEQHGQIHDIVYNPEEGRLIGFTVQQGGGLFHRGETFWLSSKDIRSIGEDAVTLESPSLLQPVESAQGEMESEAGQPVLGKRLLTENGKFLGNVDDVLIDRESRRVVAYEVSGGLWQDMMRGQTDVPVPHIITIGKDVVVVPDFVQEQVESSTGGLAAATETARGNVAAAYESASEKAAQARTEIAETIEDKEGDYARGRVAGNDVFDDQGEPIVRRGEVITDAHIQRAVAASQMHALAAAAGRAHASRVAGDVRERAAQATESVKERASDLAESVRKTPDDQIIGRTTIHAVLMENGQPLVPSGHVVTTADVLAARNAGKWDDLAAAVEPDVVETAGTAPSVVLVEPPAAPPVVIVERSPSSAPAGDAPVLDADIVRDEERPTSTP